MLTVEKSVDIVKDIHNFFVVVYTDILMLYLQSATEIAELL